MAFPHIGYPELLIVLFIVLVIFGVGKLPQVGGALGKGIREFRKGQSGEAEEPPKKELEAGKEEKKD